MSNQLRTGLILQTVSTKEFKLPETLKIICIQSKFSVDSFSGFIYSIEDGISVYTTNPFNRVKKLDYKNEIKEISSSPSDLCLLNDESLVLYSKDKFNVISKDFKNMTVKHMGNSQIATHNRKELILYNKNLIEIDRMRCQCYFYMRDVFLLGDMNTIKVWIKNVKSLEVSAVDYITSIVADPLFRRIIYATQDNNIYCFDLNGQPLKTMSYHEKPVKEMRISQCGQYLYSSDGTRLCVWSIDDGVVMGFIDVEEGIESFETILMEDREYDIESILI